MNTNIEKIKSFIEQLEPIVNVIKKDRHRTKVITQKFGDIFQFNKSELNPALSRVIISEKVDAGEYILLQIIDEIRKENKIVISYDGNTLTLGACRFISVGKEIRIDSHLFFVGEKAKLHITDNTFNELSNSLDEETLITLVKKARNMVVKTERLCGEVVIDANDIITSVLPKNPDLEELSRVERNGRTAYILKCKKLAKQLSYSISRVKFAKKLIKGNNTFLKMINNHKAISKTDVYKKWKTNTYDKRCDDANKEVINVKSMLVKKFINDPSIYEIFKEC